LVKFRTGKSPFTCRSW